MEVKGRNPDAQMVTLTRHELLTALNQPADFILVLVEVTGERAATPRCICRPFHREPDFGATSVNYYLDDLLARAQDPA
jgi:hypothetical protein